MKSFSVIIILSMLLTFCIYGQEVIIHEMSQGSGDAKEWVELLVVENNLDMRNWELGDLKNGIWTSIVTFADVLAWQSVKSGTIIVIYNQADIDGRITDVGGEDINFDDYSVIIAGNNTSFFVDPWTGAGQFNNGQRDDCAAIRDASDIMIHDMAVTHPATVGSPEAGKVKFYRGNTITGVLSNSNWTENLSTFGTPGQPHGGVNTLWINSLRGSSMTPTVPVSPMIVVLFFLLTVISACFRIKKTLSPIKPLNQVDCDKLINN